ncbi:DUF664 domain-containing protein [Streptomyces sp. NPDC102467]|uniref:mycothiol transferase n=1 Tax=Streptomyces sp. NPDC102467 TaxID=3366179 RepID=UPI00381EDC6F
MIPSTDEGPPIAREFRTQPQSVLPSGWTPLGLVRHLADAEHRWFQEVALGKTSTPPGPPNSPLRAPQR